MDRVPDPWFQTRISFPPIGVEASLKLSEPLQDGEVKRALFQMGPWKAPGPDGFPAGFYQHSWSMVAQSVCSFVQDIWHNPHLLQTVNFTDISLIPKVQRPEFVTQFRPISLCNTIYKVVSKVIVNRLKEVIPLVISPFQAGFVPGRCIQENIVIAQEISHSMRNMNGKRGFFAIKVDLAKAYDKLHWTFIHHILQEVGIPNDLLQVVMHGISSVRTNVMWNGVRSDFFTPQRGIRQGDPLSPYIFVLCMDKLSHLISQAVEDGNWKPMKAGRTGPQISHLMFVDDLLLFGEATEKQMNCVMQVLGQFCALSGQQVSNENTTIMFSKNVGSSSRRRLVQI